MVAADTNESIEPLPKAVTTPEAAQPTELKLQPTQQAAQETMFRLDAETKAMQTLVALKKQSIDGTKPVHHVAREIYWRPDQDEVAVVPDQVDQALTETSQSLTVATDLLQSDVTSADLQVAAPLLVDASDRIHQAESQLETLNSTLGAALEHVHSQERSIFWQYPVPESVKLLLSDLPSHATLDEARDRLQELKGEARLRLESASASMVARALSVARLAPPAVRTPTQELRQLTGEYESVLHLIEQRERQRAPLQETEQRLLEAARKIDVQREQATQLAAVVAATIDSSLKHQATVLRQTIESTSQTTDLFGLPTDRTLSAAELVAYWTQFNQLRQSGVAVRVNQKTLSEFEAASEQARRMMQEKETIDRVRQNPQELAAELQADWQQPQRLELLQLLNRLAHQGRLREETVSLLQPLRNEFAAVVEIPTDPSIVNKQQEVYLYRAAWESLVSLALYGQKQEAVESQTVIAARIAQVLEHFRPNQLDARQEPRFIEGLAGMVLEEYLRPLDAASREALTQMIEPAIQSVLNDYGIAVKPFLAALREGTETLSGVNVHAQLVLDRTFALLGKIQEFPGLIPGSKEKVRRSCWKTISIDSSSSKLIIQALDDFSLMMQVSTISRAIPRKY